MPAEVDDVYPCTDRGEASDDQNRPFAEVDDANSLDQRRRKAGSSPAGAQQYNHKRSLACQVARLATKQDCRLALSEAWTAPPADQKKQLRCRGTVEEHTPGRTQQHRATWVSDRPSLASLEACKEAPALAWQVQLSGNSDDLKRKHKKKKVLFRTWSL